MSHVEFWTIGGLPLAPADNDAGGSMPIRAFRYCEPMRQACAFGWHLYPPCDFDLQWNGSGIAFRAWGGGMPEPWQPLQPSAWLPGAAEAWDAEAPDALRHMAPPSLTALPEPGTVQISFGVAARIAPDWRLLLRAPANRPHGAGFENAEGMIAAPDARILFVAVRLTRTDTPIAFRDTTPIAQVQPVPLAALAIRARPSPAPVPFAALAGSMQLPDDTAPPGRYARQERRDLAAVDGGEA